MKHHSRDKGLMLLDAITGMAILGILLGVLAGAVSQHRHAATVLQSQRRLDRLAEGVLTDLQQGVPPLAEAWDTEVQPTYAINELAGEPGPCNGWRWVEVTADYDKLVSSVIGAVPEQSLAPTVDGGTP
jgi:type II secretory pathway pseudopilin PulG